MTKLFFISILLFVLFFHFTNNPWNLSSQIANNIKNDFINSSHSSVIPITNLHKLSDIEKQYVVHAGGKIEISTNGEIEEYTYLNNLEALQNSYQKGYRLIEMDIELTNDNVPIMLHSWDGFVTKFFGEDAWKIYSLEEFQNFNMVHDWHQLTLEDTIHYMQTEFQEMYLITDTKTDNKKLMQYIAFQYPNMKARIIPQVYSQEEYFYVKNLGFENIIYTLYMSQDTKEEIIEFCKTNRPFAITMPKALAYSDLPSELSKLNINTYAHTIDSETEYLELKENGIKGVYTNILWES